MGDWLSKPEPFLGDGYIYQIRMIMMGLDNVGKTQIIESYLGTLPKADVEEMMKKRKMLGGVSPYIARTIINETNVQVFLQDTLSFDDQLMTGSYLNNQAAAFMVVDPINPATFNLDKLSEMTNLASAKSKNLKL